MRHVSDSMGQIVRKFLLDSGYIVNQKALSGCFIMGQQIPLGVYLGV